ncbi:putative LPS assembly protein LptD [Flavobacterium humi]|uniref:LPS-assembly protein LptD n=1 Tax=Flavobacterium humi TaxID=2562683 RepID=A0A4Z0LC22_9FLAO|nr:putative LPS assembly protein LptD [Flavobacterium humi]TGD59439.1 LPS-assembly protein LptD [Flavobacterium humi]
MSLQKLSHNFTKIVFIALRTNLFHIVFLPFLLTFGCISSYSQELPKKRTPLAVKKQQDSVNIGLKNIAKANDTVKKDTVAKKKQLLDANIKYKSKEYATINQKKKQITLNNEAEVYYKDIELKAGIIVIDYEKDEVYAGRLKDSAGVYTQYPVFKQGSNTVEPDSIRFNFKTKKALIWNSRTDQGEMKLKGEITKRENDSVYFIKNARFTTSKNIENPEYYFLARKIKLVPGKKVVAGLTNMVIADVPTPIGVPFAFFPMTEESTSGIIIPTFGDTNARGYFLQNGGYYFALNKHYDLALLGDYYTNGSYALRAETNYAKIYKFRGSFNFRYENLIENERGLPDYRKSSIYNIQWTHSPDIKATPSSRFSASVNLGSQKYYQNSLNQLNSANFLNNTLQSSISYAKTFNTVPQVNMSLTASHQQNTNTGEINMTLPTLQASVAQIFPFAPKDGSKKGIIKNINFQYNLRGENRINTVDSLFFKPQMFRDAKNGLQHSIPINTNFKIFKHFSVTAGTNYQETWYLKTIEKKYNTTTNTVESIDKNGFSAFRTYDFNSGIGTTIYGTFNFKKDSRIQAIRHVMTPRIGYTYTPSFKRYYDDYVADANGTIRSYTRFENGIFGAPGLTYSNIMGFTLGNTLEAKVKDRDSTKTDLKKIKLLNSLNFSTRYNLSAEKDQPAWAPLDISGGTNILKDKMNINFNATLDPYAIDSKGKTVNKFNIDNGGSLFRMTRASLTVNYALTSKREDTKKQDSFNNQGLRNGGREDNLFGTTTDFSDRRESQFDKDKEDEPFSGFFNAKIPWDLRLAYSLSYTNDNRQNKISQSSLMFSGDIDITPKWKAGISSGYDFVQNGVTYTQLRFERDLLSWRMDFNWNPYGDRASWYFFIGISSSVLSDIKWDKRNVPDRRL